MEKLIAILVMLGIAASISFGVDQIFALHTKQDVLAKAISGKLVDTARQVKQKITTKIQKPSRIALSQIAVMGGTSPKAESVHVTPTPTAPPHAPEPTVVSPTPTSSPTAPPERDPVALTPEDPKPTHDDPPNHGHRRPTPTIEVPPPIHVELGGDISLNVGI